MTTTLNTPDGTITVDHASGEVLLECTNAYGAVPMWLPYEQAWKLAVEIGDAALAAMRSERENREPRACPSCGDTRQLCSPERCVAAENE